MDVAVTRRRVVTVGAATLAISLVAIGAAMPARAQAPTPPGGATEYPTEESLGAAAVGAASALTTEAADAATGSSGSSTTDDVAAAEAGADATAPQDDATAGAQQAAGDPAAGTDGELPFTGAWTMPLLALGAALLLGGASLALAARRIRTRLE